MSAAVALQRAIRARLIDTPAVVAIVPAAQIWDRNQRPAADTCINLGEADALDDGDFAQARQRVTAILHLWRREESLEGVALLAGAVRAAIHAAPLDLAAPHRCVGVWVAGVRTMRDPSGEFAHAVVTVSAFVEEIAS